MRNILGLIKRFYVFLMFLALQILALVMLFSNNNYHRSEFVQHSSRLAGEVFSLRANWAEYIRLAEINDRLALENAILRSQLPENFRISTTDSSVVEDTTAKKIFIYRTAKVINASVNREKNFLMLDKGSDEGVKAGMGVVANGAIVGSIASVSQNFAVVMPILHRDFKASVRLKKFGVFGSLVWPGGNPAYADVIEIPKNIPIALGDTIVSSGLSTIYPGNLMVGTVSAVDDDADNDYHMIKVQLSTDFRRLDHVMIVDNRKKEEQIQLLENTVGQDAANDHH